MGQPRNDEPSSNDNDNDGKVKQNSMIKNFENKAVRPDQNKSPKKLTKRRKAKYKTIKN